MRTYDIKDAEGRVFAFEIRNLFYGRHSVSRLVRKIPGVKILRTPKPFSWFREEVFCEFEVAETVFHVWEPFGDNSRYWIGPEDAKWHPEIELIKRTFSNR